jgi:plasmid stabilization system protein ParE
VRVIWSPAALRQVTRAYEYLEDFNPYAATALAEALLAAGDSLENFPHRGRRVPGVDLRELVTAYPYFIPSATGSYATASAFSAFAIPRGGRPNLEPLPFVRPRAGRVRVDDLDARTVKSERSDRQKMPAARPMPPSAARISLLTHYNSHAVQTV